VSSTNAKILAAFALVLTFGVGIIVGFAASHVMMRNGPPMRSAEFITRRLDRRLHLTPAQRREVLTIVARGQQRVRGVWVGVHPAIAREIDQTNSEIERILTPEQRTKFADIRMRLLPRGPDDGMRVKHD
jgi:hypothetical protein